LVLEIQGLQKKENMSSLKKLALVMLPILLLLNSCAMTIPEPTAPPEPPITDIGEPVATNIAPSPIFLNNNTYYLDNGEVCLNTTEAYNNVQRYFSFSVGRLFRELLQELGYDVIINPQSTGNCELIVDLTFEIELVSAHYKPEFAPSGITSDCYTGINIIGKFDIALPSENTHATYSFGYSQVPPKTIESGGCYQIQDNPLIAHWIENDDNSEVDQDYLMSILENLWGTRASIAMLGIQGDLEGLETLQSQALIMVRKNIQVHSLTNDDIEYLTQAVENNPSEREDYMNLLPIHLLSANTKNDIVFPMLLSFLESEDQPRLVVKELDLLKKMKIDERYANIAPPIIFDLAPTFYGKGWDEDKDKNFIGPAVDVLASLGPGVIPHAVRNLYLDQDRKPEEIFLAVGVLDSLAQDGYEDQVAQQAGPYLCYAYRLMKDDEFDYPGNIYSDAIPNLLAKLFPEVVNGEGYYTKPIKFYRAWEKLYGK
jgi:hypothetical protein